MTVFELDVNGLPPSKSGPSGLGLRSMNRARGRRAFALLEAAHRKKSAEGFRGFGLADVGLEVVLRAPRAGQPGDGTNYLGGIADVLEVKRHRVRASGPLQHLGYREHVGLYENDRQIREIRYREVEVEDEEPSYSIKLWLL